MTDKEKSFNKIFPYEYMGAGYFRKKGYDKNTKAPILHAPEAVKFIFEQLTKEK